MYNAILSDVYVQYPPPETGKSVIRVKQGHIHMYCANSKQCTEKKKYTFYFLGMFGLHSSKSSVHILIFITILNKIIVFLIYESYTKIKI